jgi:flagellar hook-associated protein 3 FlgL
MRISTQQAFQSGLQNLLNGQSNLSRLQEQVATGKRIETPGDDPVTAPQIISLNRQINLLDQYKVNSDRATNRLALEETILGSITDSVQRVRQLTVQAGNPVLDFGSRQSIAVEMNQRVEELLGLVNAQGTDNEFIFAGYQSDTQPFVRRSGGGFDYQGDNGHLSIAITNTLSINVSDSGRELFAEIAVPNNFTVEAAAANTGSAIAQSSVVTNQSLYDSFYPNDAVVTFAVSGGNTTFSVTRAAGGAAISGGVPSQALTNIPYTPGQAIAFEGIQLRVNGVPANGDVLTAEHSDPQKQDILSIVEQLAAGLNSIGAGTDENLQRRELINDALLSLDGALTSINQTVAQIGARRNTIDSVVTSNAEIKLFSQTTLSSLEDLDFTAAVSQLTQSTFVLQAAQQSYASIQNLSLFNFIRS